MFANALCFQTFAFRVQIHHVLARRTCMFGCDSRGRRGTRSTSPATRRNVAVACAPRTFFAKVLFPPMASSEKNNKNLLRNVCKRTMFSYIRLAGADSPRDRAEDLLARVRFAWQEWDAEHLAGRRVGILLSPRRRVRSS